MNNYYADSKCMLNKARHTKHSIYSNMTAGRYDNVVLDVYNSTKQLILSFLYSRDVELGNTDDNVLVATFKLILSEEQSTGTLCFD